MNVTISMDEDTLAWVRVEAARAGRSVSAWVGARLEAERQLSDTRRDAIARINAFLEDFAGLPLSEGDRITLDRDELHNEHLRRFDDATVYLGRDLAGEASHLRGVAEEPSPLGADEAEPSGPV
jgi:hypothetical protein